jgi:hypothetical protein
LLLPIDAVAEPDDTLFTVAAVRLLEFGFPAVVVS